MSGSAENTIVVATSVGAEKADGGNSVFHSSNFEVDSSINDEERRFYLRAYVTIDLVNHRKVHCTVCRSHIGTAPNSESIIKMHPILRVTHCIKCHEFYNSGEFSKGEDGSELYCRWCGQGGEVYCCSNCPFVFCKSCIVKNLSRGVVADIEQNENWNCFNCAPKILWPLRAQHWALVNYIEAQKTVCKNMNEGDMRIQLAKDSSQCCRLAKSKASGMSDSMESLESNASKRSHASVGSLKKPQKSPIHGLTAKRPKTSNDEVVCTPDLLSMLEPDCQLTVSQKTRPPMTSPATSTPKIVSVHTQPQNNTPPPLVLANTSIKVRQIMPQQTILRRPVLGTRPAAPVPQGATSPVYHTINGFRIDLNSAAQQETFRLPNGKLIQVKRQGTAPPQQQPGTTTSGGQLLIRPRTLQPNVLRPMPPMIQNNFSHNPNLTIHQQQTPPSMVRISNVQSTHGSTSITPMSSANGVAVPPGQPARPQLNRYVFPSSPIGQARTQLQDQIFNAMDICTHLTGKISSLTNSNAYKQARNYLEVKELYIHLSYLFTYAIGRFKGVQDKCLTDMRQLGFTNDADSLENGQLAAGVDYVCYGQLEDVDLFNTGSNSFHNQVYEYRKSLHANLKDGESEPLPPLVPLGVRAEGDPEDDENYEEVEALTKDDNEDNDVDDPDENLYDNDGGDDLEGDDYGSNAYDSTTDSGAMCGTEESMTRNEQAHAYDRKLTRLIREYPSIWCTKHPDYGNFEVTRKQWRVVASHFKRGDNIKLRWKNIRKRYVRIERRTKQGKRFNGYFDKATNYLSNRDFVENEWREVDCGDDDGDVYERKDLDAIEVTLNDKKKDEDVTKGSAIRRDTNITRPIEVRPIDARIIFFAKSHPVLWRKSSDPQFDSIDEQTRKSLWANFWKSMPNKQASDDDEIEIVEPKTDTITIDSDNEDESSTSLATARARKTDTVVDNSTDNIDVNNITSSILATMLEVDLREGDALNMPQTTSPNEGGIHRKQPRKKTTNKPNPALLQLERDRLEELKRTDAKLKKKVVIKLTRAELKYPIAKQWLENQQSQKLFNKTVNTTANNVSENQSRQEEECVVKEKECEKILESIDNRTEKLSLAETNLVSSLPDDSIKCLEAGEANVVERECGKTMVTSDNRTEKLMLAAPNLVSSFLDDSIKCLQADEENFEERGAGKTMEARDNSTKNLNLPKPNLVYLFPDDSTKCLEAGEANIVERECGKTMETSDNSVEKLSLSETYMVSSFPDDSIKCLEADEENVEERGGGKTMESSDNSTKNLNLSKPNLESLFPDQPIKCLEACEANLEERESGKTMETNDNSTEKLSSASPNLVSSFLDGSIKCLEVDEANVEERECGKTMEASDNSTEKLSLVELNLVTLFPDQSITSLKADEPNVAAPVDSITDNFNFGEQNVTCTSILKEQSQKVDESMDAKSHVESSTPIVCQTLPEMTIAENEFNVQLVGACELKAAEKNVSNSKNTVNDDNKDLKIKETQDIAMKEVIENESQKSNAELINVNYFTSDNVATSVSAHANDKDESVQEANLNTRKVVQLIDLELEDIVSDDSNLITLTESISATEMSLNELDLGLNTVENSGASVENTSEITQEVGVRLVG